MSAVNYKQTGTYLLFTQDTSELQCYLGRNVDVVDAAVPA